MTVTVDNEGKGQLSYDLVGVAAVTGGGQGAIPNTEGVDLHILRAFLLVKTQSDVAGNLSIGVAADETTSATDILNADAMADPTEGSIINCFAQDPGAKTKLVPAVWSSGKFLTFTASSSLVGLTARLYVEYLRT